MFVTVTVLVTLVTRAACFSPRAPVITSQPRSLRAPLSDGVTLACTVEHLGALVVVWKHGEEVVTAGSMMVSPDPRYRYIAVQYSAVQYSTIYSNLHRLDIDPSHGSHEMCDAGRRGSDVPRLAA